MGLQPFPGAGFFHNGQVSPIITAMGQRLVEEGCSQYQVGPGPEFSDADRASYAAFQRKLGFSGGDADGIPGQTSWDRLRVPAPNGTGDRADSPVPAHGVTTAYHIPGPWSLGYHTGADYAADEGTPCVAVLGGSISHTGESPNDYGNYLVLRANGSDYWYCHLSERDVGDGAGVGAGQQIARVGHTGNATGPHLHFEKRPAGGAFGSDVSPDW
ncbi:hypothetical protein GCM10010441_43300 [Kitasatospora paracochleata]|uniref:Murein DD-endopeptidase MepM/ murein hydrolase activator NlpD n=1 Tax=Kitasatospora paracochleata TaxID=58354 RepID=A0ABT1J2C8_9ACTN|nr:murein DD-endopeptidase MepM/ murein hydrolase activator NlpD [Kitasatospora paracochleata]